MLHLPRNAERARARHPVPCRAGRGHAAYMLRTLLGAPDGVQNPVEALDRVPALREQGRDAIFSGLVSLPIVTKL